MYEFLLHYNLKNPFNNLPSVLYKSLPLALNYLMQTIWLFGKTMILLPAH